MNDFKVGIVVDFENYKNYFNRFYKKYQNKVIEFHILEKDLEQEEKFISRLEGVEEFLRENGIKDVSFHSVDRIVQSVLFNEKSSHLESDKKKFYLMLDQLVALSKNLDYEILLVVHQGVKILASSLENKSDKEIDAYREKMLKQAEQGYKLLNDYLKGSKLLPVLENSPPSCAFDSKIHFMDLAFEDFEPRLKNTGRFAFDISHAAMCVEYFKQDKVKFVALESLRRKYGGVPESLKSMENYVKKSGKNIVWIHVNDANGILGENEGLVIGVKGSLINFKKVTNFIKKNVANPIGVIEIVDAHKDYRLIAKSLIKFTNKLN